MAQMFDPVQVMSKIKGRDYLEVKWRIAWLRQEHPNAVIETTLLSQEDGRAIIKAYITIPDGGIATGHGSETAQAFENYIEKAETKAIGRALTALGYGTPLSEPEENGDGPELTQSRSLGAAHLATGPQRGKIRRLAQELRMDERKLNEVIIQHTGSSLEQINKRQASGVIDLLESRMPARQAS